MKPLVYAVILSLTTFSAFAKQKTGFRALVSKSA